MKPPEPADLVVETDSRFPSGPWTGFFLQPLMPGRHGMDMILTFRDGLIRGEGNDRVGKFTFKGRYQVEDGRCWWSKSYVKAHSIAYQGYNEGKGIWGTWEESPINKGGFRIWPVAMGDPTQVKLSEAIDQPVEAPSPLLPEPVAEPVPEEVGAPAGRSSPIIDLRGR